MKNWKFNLLKKFVISGIISMGVLGGLVSYANPKTNKDSHHLIPGSVLIQKDATLTGKDVEIRYRVCSSPFGNPETKCTLLTSYTLNPYTIIHTRDSMRKDNSYNVWLGVIAILVNHKIHYFGYSVNPNVPLCSQLVYSGPNPRVYITFTQLVNGEVGCELGYL